jgi:HEXXH motif-containing protein
MFDSHRLSQVSLDTMAEGSGDPALVEQLRHAYRSRQLTLLRAVLERAETLGGVTGSLPSLGDGWGLLADVQRRDGAAVDSVIMLPRTGLWTREVLRLLDADTVPERPLWTVIGYFHQMVAAAAILAGYDVKWTVPAWRGTVLLPSLGLVEIPSDDEWSVAEVWHDDGHVVIHGPGGSTELPSDLSSDGPGWLSLRALRIGDRGLWLDDIDPNREFGAPIPPRRLSNIEVAQWARGFRETWQLLADHHPAIAGELAAGLSTLVPYPMTDEVGPYSASHNDAFGSVVLSRPPDATTFAELLIHEFGHSKFGVLLSLVDLLEPGGDNDSPRLYAPWRDDPRPPAGVLHGVYSFLGVTAFYRAHSVVVTGLPARVAQFEFEFHRVRTIQGVEGLLAQADLSELGRRFLDTVLGRLQSWAAEPLPTDVRDLAHWANADNRLCWRIRQLRPAGAVVATLVEAWRAGTAKPVVTTDSRLEPVPGHVSKARLALIRTWLSSPEQVERYRATPDSLTAEIGGATVADLALLDGDNDRATELFRQQVLAGPESPTNWAGLALASGEKALLTHPELVFRVHQEIRARSGEAVDPVQLARWLD